MKIIEVEWMDAQTGFSVPLTLEEVREEEPIITTSIGYLLDENEERIILGFMLFGGDSVKHWQLIPKGMIRKRRVLK